jgi:hypothetical protein
VLVEDLMVGSVEVRCGHLRRHRYAHCVPYALSERAGRAFHTRGLEVLRVPRRLAV